MTIKGYIMSKSRGILRALLLLAMAATILGSCDLFGDKTDPISAQETMNGFVATANAGNFSSLKQYTHSDAGQYNSATASIWNTYFSGSLPMTNLSVSGNSATAEGPGGESYEFTLAEDEPDQYKIKTMDIDGVAKFY